MRACRRRRAPGSTRPRSPASKTFSAASSATSSAAAAAAGPSAAAICATTSRSRSRSRPKASRRPIQIPRLETCDTCQRLGRGARHAARRPARSARGAASSDSSRGFSPSRARAARCQGTGRIIPKPCATCKGEGRTTNERKLTVKIPAGIADGQRLRISGEGEGGLHGGPPGDLYVFIEVAPHAFFRRDGNNLSCEIPLNFTTLALGGSIDVPTLDGHESFKVPEGTQSGTVFRLRGKGMPDVSGRGRGDLFFTVQAVTPKKLSKEQRAALEQLGKALPEGEVRAARARRGGGREEHLREGQRYFWVRPGRRSTFTCRAAIRNCRSSCSPSSTTFNPPPFRSRTTPPRSARSSRQRNRATPPRARSQRRSALTVCRIDQRRG